MARSVSMNDILFGIRASRSQSVGNMEIIPLISENRDDLIDEEKYNTPGDIDIGTTDYGTVSIDNNSDRMSFIPPGSGWVLKQASQDHAIGSGELLGPKQHRHVKTARCIQPSQGGTIKKGKYDMLILPLELRGVALAKRNNIGYSDLWDDIGRFNYNHGIKSDKNLARFIVDYKKQMDLFVAEFELIDDQVGAIIMMNGKVIGIEIVPTREYWKYVWNPLIRVCYGSLAVSSYKDNDSNVPVSNRQDFGVLTNNTLSSLKDELSRLEKMHTQAVEGLMIAIRKRNFLVGNVEQRCNGHYLLSGVSRSSSNNNRLNGQVLLTDKSVPFFSACGI